MQDATVFLFGYALLILTPGPNTMLVASQAAINGFRSCVPLIFGLSVGATLLAAVIVVMGGGLPAVVDLRTIGPPASFTALLYTAWRLLPRNPAVSRAPRRLRVADRGAIGCTIGVATAFCNPITATYFASQLLRPDSQLHALSAPTFAAVLGVFVFCTANASLMATMFSTPAWRDLAIRREAMVRRMLAAALFTYALWILWPALPHMVRPSAPLEGAP